jgi:hypothetical protein
MFPSFLLNATLALFDTTAVLGGVHVAPQSASFQTLGFRHARLSAEYTAPWYITEALLGSDPVRWSPLISAAPRVVTGLDPRGFLRRNHTARTTWTYPTRLHLHTAGLLPTFECARRHLPACCLFPCGTKVMSCP